MGRVSLCYSIRSRCVLHQRQSPPSRSRSVLPIPDQLLPGNPPPPSLPGPVLPIIPDELLPGNTADKNPPPRSRSRDTSSTATWEPPRRRKFRDKPPSTARSRSPRRSWSRTRPIWMYSPRLLVTARRSSTTFFMIGRAP